MKQSEKEKGGIMSALHSHLEFLQLLSAFQSPLL